MFATLHQDCVSGQRVHHTSPPVWMKASPLQFNEEFSRLDVTGLIRPDHKNPTHADSPDSELCIHCNSNKRRKSSFTTTADNKPFVTFVPVPLCNKKKMVEWYHASVAMKRWCQGGFGQRGELGLGLHTFYNRCASLGQFRFLNAENDQTWLH